MRIGIFGGGPAGLSAALWLRNFGFRPWVAEAGGRPGGMQNLNFLANDWVLGQRGKTGIEIAADFVSHLDEAGVPIYCGVSAQSVEGQAGEFRVQLACTDGSRRSEQCAAILIATGTRFREAEVLSAVPGFASVPSRHLVYGPYAFADLDACAGRRVLIVGGGDNAFENARLLLTVGATVDMALRSPARAQAAQRDPVLTAQAAERCRIHQPTRIVALVPQDDGVAVTLAGAADTRVVDRIHVLAGYTPNTGFLTTAFGAEAAALALDGAGYLQGDADGRTGLRGVYSAGDVCNPAFPSVVSALAQGARAAKAIEFDLYSK